MVAGMRQRITGLMVPMLCLCALVVGGCDRSKVTDCAYPVVPVRIGYFANVTHAQAVLAVPSREMALELVPCRVIPKIFNAGPALIEALNAGAIDMGYVGPGPAINSFVASDGKSLRIIAGAAANGVLIVARADSGITRLEDLAGKRLATPQLGNTQDISARHYLSAVLKQTDLSNVMPIANSEQAAMMSRGQIDAAWVPEPWASRLIAENGARRVAEEKDLWPGGEFTLTVLVTTPQFLQAHPDLVKKVLAVHHRWTLRLQTDAPAHAATLEAALYELTRQKLPAGVVAAALKNVRFTDDPLNDTLQSMAQWSYDLRLTRRRADLTGATDLTLLKQVIGQSP